MLAGVYRARTLGLAAEMSFWLFLSLVPLAAVAGLVAAKVAAQGGRMLGTILLAVPPAARAMVEQQVEQVAAMRGVRVAPVALAIFFWLAASGVHSIFDALEVQAAVERPWWKKRVLAIATCIALSLGVAVLGIIGIGLGRIEAFANGEVAQGAVESATESVLRTVAGIAVAIGMIAALYRVGIPREARARLPVLPGAVLALALIAALGWGYGVYVSTAGTGGAYQGSLAVIGVTLMTLWLFSVAVLLGAELNKVVADRRGAALGPSSSDVVSTSRGPTPSEVAGPLRGETSPWPTSNASSSPPTSPKPRSEPSTGPSPSPSVSARRSR